MFNNFLALMNIRKTTIILFKIPNLFHWSEGIKKTKKSQRIEYEKIEISLTWKFSKKKIKGVRDNFPPRISSNTTSINKKIFLISKVSYDLIMYHYLPFLLMLHSPGSYFHYCYFAIPVPVLPLF